MRDPTGENHVIDTSRAHIARAYDYLLGGTNNFAVDREMAELVSAAVPGGIAVAKMNVRADRTFLRQTVRWLARDIGVRQFLDIGTGIPNADNVHAVALQTAADAKVVYVDYDPIVLAHAHVLLEDTPEGSTAYIDGDLRNPDNILAEAAKTLDLSQPVAMLLLGVLHYIEDHENPYGIVTRLLDAVPAGSYLAVTHLANDVMPEVMADMAERAEESPAAMTMVTRSHADVARFFAGLELLPPGVVSLDQWPRDDERWSELPEGHIVPIYGGVALKPGDG